MGERRLIRLMERRGGRAFRILRSAEKPLRTYKRPTPTTARDNCEPGNSSCKSLGCPQRQEHRHSKWWCEYGTCSRDHAIDYYGEEAVE